MANPKINWEDARYFLAVARSGKLNLAAEVLGISPITLSRRMTAMAERMNTVLIARHNLGVELTDEGVKLVEYLERAEREIDAASEAFDSHAMRVSGAVRIAAPEGFALEFLAKNMNQFLDIHPLLRIELVPLPRGFSLSRREADIAIMVGKPEGKELYSEMLSTYRLGLFASENYLKNYDEPLNVHELSEHKLIGYVDDLLYSERLNTPREIFKDWRNHISINSPLGQIEAVKSGAGIGVLHLFLLEHNHGLKRILKQVEIKREFWMVTHSNLRNIPRIAAAMTLIDRLIDQAVATQWPE